jgi:acetoin utilization deacetylase AcuC-like enzyme
LPAGSGSAKVFAAFRELLLPAANEFRPDLILISAGFDSRVGDPLGQLLLRDEDFRQLTAMLGDVAATYCQGRLVSVLEGGYNLEGLALATDAHIRALLDQTAEQGGSYVKTARSR